MKKLLALLLTLCMLFTVPALAAEQEQLPAGTAETDIIPEAPIDSEPPSDIPISAEPDPSQAPAEDDTPPDLLDSALSKPEASPDLLPTETKPSVLPPDVSEPVSELPVDTYDTGGDTLDTAVLDLIAGLVSNIANDPPVWYVNDLRTPNEPVVVSDGLKALVTSIFGEYTPVTTTEVITQTVDNDTYQYLVEVVAPGSAGVDYEWIAGVVLFAILLYCFMKLLGGVLK